MLRKTLILAALLSIPMIGGSKAAQAEEYCREYTKTVSIGGRPERAYGTACYKPDGSWEIVNLEGSDYGRSQVREVIYDDLNRQYDRRDRVVIVERARYTPYYTHYRSRTYNPISLSFMFGDDDHHHKHYKHYKHKYKHHDRHDDDHRGRGRGRGRDHD